MNKRNVLIIATLAAVMIFSGCQTQTKTYRQNGIDLFPSFSLEKLSSEDYTVIETIRGTSEIIVTNKGLQGDTGKYGVINDAEGFSNILRLVTNEKWRIQNPETIARLNANYDIIEKANEILADALWMPRVNKEVVIEGDKLIIRVTIIAKAVQIINK